MVLSNFNMIGVMQLNSRNYILVFKASIDNSWVLEKIGKMGEEWTEIYGVRRDKIDNEFQSNT